jgi:hypothetical protein
MQDDSFDLALGRAALEAHDPELAHWIVGLAAQAERRAMSLIESGQLSSFEYCQVGIAKRRIPAREDALFRDGTSLVMVKRREPWEAAELARRAMAEGEVWVCLRLTQRINGGGPNMVWACANLSGAQRMAFDEFWPHCALELARAEVQSVEDLSGRGYFKQRQKELSDLRERALAFMEREGLALTLPLPSASPERENEQPSRL